MSVVAGALAAVTVGGVVHADAAQPTDYRSEVVAITPAVPGLSARIVGGDSFIELTVTGDHEVIVLGYADEPYLRFAPDGTVSENVRSPAHFFNESRYATVSLPPEADASAAPDWHVIGHGGSWAWHDHRTHWMADTPPLGVRVGDQIMDDVVPLLVDGAEVSVSVVSVWEPAPSPWPSVVAALVAAGAAFAVVRGTRDRRWVVVGTVAVTAVGAEVVGIWQTWSLPSETGPPLSHWVLPLTAVVAAALAAAWWHNPFMARAAVAVAATQLVVWSIVRRSVLDHAILPTSAPFWLDRLVTAAVFGVAAVVLVDAVVAVVRTPGLFRATSARAPG